MLQGDVRYTDRDAQQVTRAGARLQGNIKPRQLRHRDRI